MRGLKIALAALVATAAGAWEFARLYKAPDGVILLNTSTAQWIKADESLDLSARRVNLKRTIFRRAFDLSNVRAGLTFRVRSFRNCQVFVNGVPLEPKARGIPPWVAGDLYEVSSTLREGPNEVLVAVENSRGPPGLLVDAELPEFRTGRGWVASAQHNLTAPVPVKLVSESLSHPIQEAFPSASVGLARVAPYLVGAFLLGFVAAIYFSGTRSVNPALVLNPSRARWLMTCAWAIVCANGLFHLPSYIGFDVQAHLEYIAFILTRGSLPLATDGWQSFQSPLYYLLTAGLVRIILPNLAAAARLVSILSGIALIEFAYRSAKCVFSERPALQTVAVVIAGTVPMRYYICQEIGNEPLAGAIGAGVLYLCLRAVCSPDRVSPRLTGAFLGGLLGLALLAKVSAVLLMPVTAWVLWYRFRSQGARAALAAGMGFVASAGLVAGWYFARNWWRLGRPFVGGWEAGRGIDWWQDPGYRSLADLMRFGEALHRPMYSALAGLWNSLYASLWLDGFASAMVFRSDAPAWNYDFMVALAPLALPLSLAVMAGILLIAATREPAVRVALTVSAAAVLSFLGGIVHLYLTVPFYSAAKATYALSILPALALLAARGLERLVDNRWFRAVLSGYLTSWTLCVFAAFFAG